MHNAQGSHNCHSEDSLSCQCIPRQRTWVFKVSSEGTAFFISMQCQVHGVANSHYLFLNVLDLSWPPGIKLGLPGGNMKCVHVRTVKIPPQRKGEKGRG